MTITRAGGFITTCFIVLVVLALAGTADAARGGAQDATDPSHGPPHDRARGGPGAERSHGADARDDARAHPDRGSGHTAARHAGNADDRPLERGPEARGLDAHAAPRAERAAATDAQAPRHTLQDGEGPTPHDAPSARNARREPPVEPHEPPGRMDAPGHGNGNAPARADAPSGATTPDSASAPRDDPPGKARGRPDHSRDAPPGLAAARVHPNAPWHGHATAEPALAGDDAAVDTVSTLPVLAAQATRTVRPFADVAAVPSPSPAPAVAPSAAPAPVPEPPAAAPASGTRGTRGRARGLLARFGGMFLAALGWRRVNGGNALRHDTRALILEHVRANPGAHLRAIARDLDLTPQNAAHHTRTLEKCGHLGVTRVGRRACYYPANEGRDVKERARSRAAATGRVRQRVLALVTTHPGLHQAEIARRLDIAHGSVSFAVKRLVESGLLVEEKDGNRLKYAPGAILARATPAAAAAAATKAGASPA